MCEFFIYPFLSSFLQIELLYIFIPTVYHCNLHNLPHTMLSTTLKEIILRQSSFVGLNIILRPVLDSFTHVETTTAAVEVPQILICCMTP